MTLRLTRWEFDLLQARRVHKSPSFTQHERRQKVNKGLRWEEMFATQLGLEGFTGRFVREYRFVEDRRFRFDFAFVPEKFAIEIDGVVHRIKKRFAADREKNQLAMLGSWRVLRVGPDQVRNGEALSLVKRLLVVAEDIKTPIAGA